MLLTNERLQAKPTIFKAFTGVSVSEFETLLTQSTPLWVECEQQRLTRPDRQRAPGGDCKPKFGLRDQVLVTLVWLRLYLTTEILSFLFGIRSLVVFTVILFCYSIRRIGAVVQGAPFLYSLYYFRERSVARSASAEPTTCAPARLSPPMLVCCATRFWQIEILLP